MFSSLWLAVFMLPYKAIGFLGGSCIRSTVDERYLSVRPYRLRKGGGDARVNTRKGLLLPRYHSAMPDDAKINTTKFEEAQLEARQPQMSWRRRVKAAAASFTESGLITYLTISVVWYSTGMTLALAGMQKAELASQAAASGGAFKIALRKVITAWGLTFVASQLAAGFKVIAAGLLSPVAALGIHRLRKRLPPRAPNWFAPFLITAALLSIFSLLIFSLTLREAATIAVSTTLLDS